MAGKKESEPFPETEEELAKLREAASNKPDTVKGPRVTELVTATGAVTITAEELRQLSFNQLVDSFGATTSDEAIGTDQFGPILEDKGRLVGVPCILVHWEFYAGDFGEFVSMWVQTPNDDRFIVNDGSTGIYAQLKQLTAEKKINGMVACKHGLRVSEYEYEAKDGSLRPAKTFYIDTKL